MSCVVKNPKVKDIDIVEISKETDHKHEEHTEKKCIWPLDDEHWGEVQEAEFFNGLLKVFVCEAHIEWHMAILALHKAGWDVEEILAMTKDQCLTLASKLMVPIVDP